MTAKQDFPYNYPTSEKTFLDACKEFLDHIEQEEAENFRRAGALIAGRIQEGEVIYVIGCGGHSWVPPMDMFCRAGGLVPVSATMDVSTSTLTGGFRGVFTERVPGYMRAVLQYYRIGAGDVAIIFNNVGVNALTIDVALECRERGGRTIGVAGSPWQDFLDDDAPVRHPSRKNLKEIVDVFIDDYNPVGDCAIRLDGLDVPIAPISTITDGYIARRIEIEAVQELLRNGYTPPVWVSANSPNGDAINERYIEQYFYKVKAM
ncbi:MAG: sugar isomerase domain-containing protein [Spirochaetales bacterium]|nr:sugar isomerase domain-containing protein [Spirochaetales bacterium]